MKRIMNQAGEMEKEILKRRRLKKSVFFEIAKTIYSLSVAIPEMKLGGVKNCLLHLVKGIFCKRRKAGNLLDFVPLRPCPCLPPLHKVERGNKGERLRFVLF